MMGIYDRDYYQEQRSGINLGGDRTMVTNLILINVAVYLFELFMPGQLDSRFALDSQLASHPWTFYQLLTYGFLHDPDKLLHIVFNMLGLWFFGRDVEWKYGRREFLFLYLSLVILSGLAWVVVENMVSQDSTRVIGASGAVTGVLLLFALNYPRRTVLVWFVLPAPAWVFAILLILLDLRGAVTRTGNVAYVCHLAGAALAFVYFFSGWSLGRLIPGRFSVKTFRSQPKLRLHDPPEHETNMSQQVDEILRKIQQHGQDSLTRKERRTLEEASRRYQRKNPYSK